MAITREDRQRLRELLAKTREPGFDPALQFSATVVVCELAAEMGPALDRIDELEREFETIGALFPRTMERERRIRELEAVNAAMMDDLAAALARIATLEAALEATRRDVAGPTGVMTIHVALSPGPPDGEGSGG